MSKANGGECHGCGKPVKGGHNAATCGRSKNAMVPVFAGVPHQPNLVASGNAGAVARETISPTDQAYRTLRKRELGIDSQVEALVAAQVLERAMEWEGEVSILHDKSGTVRVCLAFEPCSDYGEASSFEGEPVFSELEIVVEDGKYSVSRMNFTNPVDPQKYWDEQEDLMSESKDVKAVLSIIDSAANGGETGVLESIPPSGWKITDDDFPWGPMPGQ